MWGYWDAGTKLFKQKFDQKLTRNGKCGDTGIRTQI